MGIKHNIVYCFCISKKCHFFKLHKLTKFAVRGNITVTLIPRIPVAYCVVSALEISFTSISVGVWEISIDVNVWEREKFHLWNAGDQSSMSEEQGCCKVGVKGRPRPSCWVWLASPTPKLFQFDKNPKFCSIETQNFLHPKSCWVWHYFGIPLPLSEFLVVGSIVGELISPPHPPFQANLSATSG